MQQRHTEIINLVNQEGRASVNKLSELLGVSEVTIRHDLNKLEQEGFIKRVHGGAIPDNTDSVSHRLSLNYDRKRQIAIKAAGLVGHGETILVEGGSVNALLAKQLAERTDITIITPSTYIAHLMKDTPVKIIVLGGLYQHESEVLVGPLAKLCIKHTHFTKAFLGVDGFHPDTGFTSRDMMRADVGTAIIEKGQQNIVLTDSSKFGKIHNTPLYTAEQISTVITDQLAPAKELAVLQAAGVDVLQA